QRPRVDSLAQDHARIVAEFRVELTVSDVDGVDLRGTELEEAVGEAAGRSSDVETDETARVQVERLEPRRELDAAAGDAGVRGPLDRDLRGLVDRRPGLVRAAAGHRDGAGEDHALRFLARRSETARDEQPVEPDAGHFAIRKSKGLSPTLPDRRRARTLRGRDRFRSAA